MQVHYSYIKVFLVIQAIVFSCLSVHSQALDPYLQGLIQKGINKNHSLKVNGYSEEQAKVEQHLAKATFIPKVTLNGSYTRLNDDITFDQNTEDLLMATQKLLIKEALGLSFNSPFPDGIELQEPENLQNKNILKSSVDVDWVLFSGFEVTNAIKASKHKATSLNYLGLAEKDKIAIQIITAYDQLALVYASEKVLTSSENYLKEQELFVKKAIKNGLATPLERKKIELAQQRLKGKQIDYQNKKNVLIEQLFQLTGEDRVQLAQMVPQLEYQQLSEELPAEKRNEIKALEETEMALHYKAKKEKSHAVPKIAAKGHYEFLEDDLSLLDPQWYVGVGIKWNIFDGTQTYLKAKKTELERMKYRAKKEEAEEMIALSIVNAQGNYDSKVQSVNIVNKEVELAQETYNLVNKQYKNNLVTINEVLDALTDLEQVKFKQQEAIYQQRRALIDLLHAKGILRY